MLQRVLSSRLTRIGGLNRQFASLFLISPGLSAYQSVFVPCLCLVGTSCPIVKVYAKLSNKCCISLNAQLYSSFSNCYVLFMKQFHMVEATYRVKEARKQLYSKNGRQPNDEELAEATGLSMKRLAAVLLTPKAPRSLEQKIGINQNLKPSVRPILDSNSSIA